MIKFFKDEQGQFSMMRLIAFCAASVGLVVILGALAGWLAHRPEAVAIMGIGAGLVTGGELFKWLQKKVENGGS